MTELVSVFHGTNGKIGRLVDRKKIDIYHAFPVHSISPNISSHISDATPYSFRGGVVLEYTIPASELVEVGDAGWYTPRRTLDRTQWGQIPTEYRVEMYNAGLIVSGTLNNPEIWPTDIALSVLSGEYFTAMHSHVHAMILSLKEKR